MYPGFEPDASSSTTKSGVLLQSRLESGVKSQALQAWKDQTYIPTLPETYTPPLPGNGVHKPTPALSPSPTPTLEFIISDPSKYTPGYSKESLLTNKYSSEKAAMLNSRQTPTEAKNPVAPVSASGKNVVQANNQFALEFYSRLIKDPKQAGKNIFFSPWSISSALAVTYEGARGLTANEIQSVFHFPVDAATRQKGFSEITGGLNKGGLGYTLRTANALWADKRHSFLPSYTGIARSFYSAQVTNLEFIGSPESSRETINQWVKEQTANRIQNLLPEGSIHPLTPLVITNAIYFKGTWDKQFEKKNTIEEDFRISPSQTVRVPMMQSTDEYWYAETGTFQALGMPYAHMNGKELSMLVILPRDDDLEAVESSLTPQEVSKVQQALVYHQVKVYFPKFKLETEYRLGDALIKMGMPTAFCSYADFSGMDGTGELWIDEVYHKAFVDVNEEGTEAAAATAVTMTMAYYSDFEPIPVFRADHPFIFLIQDNDTGNILFMGRVVNPNG
jgi:serpin B